MKIFSKALGDSPQNPNLVLLSNCVPMSEIINYIDFYNILFFLPSLCSSSPDLYELSG